LRDEFSIFYHYFVHQNLFFFVPQFSDPGGSIHHILTSRIQPVKQLYLLLSSIMSSSMDTETIDPSVKDSEFVSELATKPLRVCCYGSSSSMTPEKYLKEARSLGYILAKRGHTCVNGAGSFGCMAALNDGAAIGNGHIVGVIHEMFVVDGSDWCVRDGGAHEVFRNPNDRSGPIREILVAGGDDLQERKRLLVEGADALVVLPGGPGTWDEVSIVIGGNFKIVSSF
jgi:predicted Rossmann-fold nucleotide-binding protein